MLRFSSLRSSVRGILCNRFSFNYRSFYTPDTISNLTAEQKELKEAIRTFTEVELPLERANQIDIDNDFPSDMWKKFGDMGILGVTVSEEDGGMGLGYFEHSIII